MTVASAAIDVAKSHGRSRVSNGTALLPGVDGRSTWVRRLRDLMALHLFDLGGDDAVSEAERSIVRRVATLTVELERLESGFALAGEALPAQIDLYQRTANSLRRLLEAIGLERRPRDVSTLTIRERLIAEAEIRDQLIAEAEARDEAEAAGDV